MKLLGYLLLILSLLITFIIYKILLKRRIYVTPFIIFASINLGGIYTSIYAVDNYFVDNYKALFVYFSITLSFSLVYYFTTKHIAPVKNNITNYSNIDFVDTSSYLKHKYYHVYLLVFSLMIIIGIYQYNGFPPLISVISDLFDGGISQNSILSYKSDRLLLTKAHYFGGEYRGQGLFRTVIKFGWTYLLVFSYSVYFNSRNKKWLLLFLIAMFGSIAFVAGDGTRAPITRVFLTLLIAMTMLNKIPLRKIIKISFIILALLISLSMVSSKLYHIANSGEGLIYSAFESILLRILTGNQINDVIAIDYFDRGLIQHYFGQQHVIQLINSLPGVSSYDSFSLTLANIYNTGSNTTYMSPTYLAVAYADFGFIGSVIIYGLLGFFIGMSEKVIFSLPKNSINFTIGSILLLELGFMALSGLIKLIPSLIVIFIIYFLALISLKFVLSKGRYKKSFLRGVKYHEI